jgi:hypothetical protein
MKRRDAQRQERIHLLEVEEKARVLVREFQEWDKSPAILANPELIDALHELSAEFPDLVSKEAESP